MSTKNTQEYKFNNSFSSIIKGMLISVKNILDFNEKLGHEGDPEAFSPGCLTSATILSSFSAELLLKYKLTEEGKKFREIHDLCKLYGKLEPESKLSIEDKYSRLTSDIKLPDNYNSVKSVYSTSKDDFVKWRYITITPNDYIKNNITTTYPYYIHQANVSVYENTQLPKNFNRQEVPDDELKTLSEQDIKNMGMSNEFIKNLRNK